MAGTTMQMQNVSNVSRLFIMFIYVLFMFLLAGLPGFARDSWASLCQFVHFIFT